MDEEGGYAEVVQPLLAHGGDPHASDTDAETALLKAVYFQHAEIGESLIQHGLWLDHKASWGRTALCAAVAESRLDLVDILLRAGAPYPAA